MEFLDKDQFVITITNETIVDYCEILSLLGEFDEEFYPRHSSLVIHEHYAKKLAENSKCIRVFCDGMLSACAFYYENTAANDIYITFLCVKLIFRRKGLSSKIIDYLTKKYSNNYKSISLLVRVDNTPAIKFYRAKDFVFISQNDKQYLMRKCI